MSVRREIGKLLVAGEMVGGVGRAEDDPALIAALEAGEVGGFYLGYPHFLDPEEARRTVGKLQSHSPLRLFIAADLESGPGYNCAAGCAHFPYLMGLGAIDDVEVTRRVAEVTGRQALAMGINWLFSPCVDVNLRVDNPIIGIRSFGEDPARVAAMGAAYVRGCAEGGVLCTAKHFPGTGNTVADTHVGVAQDVGDLATWEAQTLPPFEAAIRAGVPTVMTGHAAMPFLDDGVLPATFSRRVLDGILRERMGFRGVVISDHLGMGGAAAQIPLTERCVRAFEAGCDMLLTPFTPDVVPAFEEALRTGRFTEKRLRASIERVEAARRRIAGVECGAISAQDQAFAFEVGRRSGRVQKGTARLPVRPGEFGIITQWRDDEAQYFPREPGVLSRLQHSIRAVDPAAPVVNVSRACPPETHAQAMEALSGVRRVVFCAIVKHYAADPYRGGLSAGTVRLLRTLAQRGHEVVLAILGSPYVCGQVQEAAVAVWAGGDTEGCAAGALEALFGQPVADRPSSTRDGRG